LKTALAPHHQRFREIYQPIRHAYFAHRGTASGEAIYALFQKTLVSEVAEILRFLHTLIYSIDQMAINGRPLDLTDFQDYDNWVKSLDKQIEDFVKANLIGTQ
jgi:hypothetical protein